MQSLCMPMGNAKTSLRGLRTFCVAAGHQSFRDAAEKLYITASSSEFRDTLKIKAKKVVSEFPRIVHESRPKAWMQWQRSAGIALPEEATTVRLDSMIAVVRAAQRGLGAALVPVRLCGTMLGSGTLVPVFEHELATADAFYFVCSKEDTGNENVQMLRDWVVQTFAGSR